MCCDIFFNLGQLRSTSGQVNFLGYLSDGQVVFKSCSEHWNGAWKWAKFCKFSETFLAFPEGFHCMHIAGINHTIHCRLEIRSLWFRDFVLGKAVFHFSIFIKTIGIQHDRLSLLQSFQKPVYNMSSTIIDSMILHTANSDINHSLNSQKTPHSLPSWASYGVSIVSIWKKNQSVIMAPYCSVVYI